MDIKEVYLPIKDQLQRVEGELVNVLHCDSEIYRNSVTEIINHFFKIPGKRLRPALALLSAGMINDNLPSKPNDKLIKLAVILELIHSTSLIHDDIIDNDTLRRGQKTLNGIYGRKIAVLAGDVLYARTFAILSQEMPPSFVKEIVRLTEDMCEAEVLQAKDAVMTHERYLSIIRGKTAEFMSLCCRLGGILAGANEKEIQALSEYGLNLGMTYQLVDDISDDDIDSTLGVNIEFAEGYAVKALEALETFNGSTYKDSLTTFVEFILSYAQCRPQQI